MNLTLGMYHHGNTPMHRTPATVKVVLLAVVGVGTLLAHHPVVSLAVMVAALLVLASVRPPWRVTTSGMIMLVIIAVFASSYHAWIGDYPRAIITGANLVGLAALAIAVASSTPMEQMLGLAAAAVRPFKRIVPPETIGLMFALMLRLIPEVARIMGESRMAAKARGLERSPRAFLIPTATRTVGFALDLGQALQARGIADNSATP